jgi:hypothetical protein
MTVIKHTKIINQSVDSNSTITIPNDSIIDYDAIASTYTGTSTVYAIKPKMILGSSSKDTTNISESQEVSDLDWIKFLRKSIVIHASNKELVDLLADKMLTDSDK